MNPQIFQFGPFSVTWFGILVAAGFVAGLWTASRRAPAEGIRSEAVLDLGPWLLLGGVGGARLWYVMTFWKEQFAGRGIGKVLAFWEGGLVFYGGLVGACVACWLYVRFKRLPIWKLADVLAPSIPLGQAFGRIGCLCYGCCYGKRSGLPWSIRFPEGHATHPFGEPGTDVHPTQLYEAALLLILYVGLARLLHKRRFAGEVFGMYLVGYALMRSLVELFRGDYPANRLFFGGYVTPAHLVSIVVLAAGLVMLKQLARAGFDSPARKTT